MRSSWKRLQDLDPDVEYLVLASRIPPKSIRSTHKLFAGARAVRKQLVSTDGVVGFALLAEPFAKHYATLSVWRDQAALDAFANAEPHRHYMSDLRPEMADTTFVTWTIRGADGVPSWDEALERLG